MQASRSRRGHALLVAGLVATNGCSAIFVRPARSPQGDVAPSCTESRAAADRPTPAVAVAALTLGAGALVRRSAAAPTVQRISDRVWRFVRRESWLLGTATSAVYGFQETGRCREAMSAFQSGKATPPFDP